MSVSEHEHHNTYEYVHVASNLCMIRTYWLVVTEILLSWMVRKSARKYRVCGLQSWIPHESIVNSIRAEFRPPHMNYAAFMPKIHSMFIRM